MSMPIVVCHIARAAKGDETAKAELKRRLEYNKGKGGFSVWGCKCEPSCGKGVEPEAVLKLCEELPDLAPIVASFNEK